MRERSPQRVSKRILSWLGLCLLIAAGPRASAQVAPGAPVLLTEGTGTTTRAVAYEAITRAAEPFAVTSPLPWGHDARTRLMLFAMSLDLLPGEGANALTADAEDAAGRIYPLKVEALSRPVFVRWGPAPGNPGLQIPLEIPQQGFYAVVLRLDDAMTDNLGDVLVRLNLHGVASNRVRVAIGQTGGGPALDPTTEFVAAAPAEVPSPAPTPTPKAYGPGEASAADVTRLLEQATWGPTTAEIERVRSIGLRAFLDEQFATPVANPAKGSNYPDLAFPHIDSNLECSDTLGQALQQVCIRDKFTVYPVQQTFFLNVMGRPDQLRQRVAFALHQIIVVSGVEVTQPSWMAPYLQVLDRHAFGSYRQLLDEITRNPAMGNYLDVNGNTRTRPNENYAREILQLFSLGTIRLHPDGTPQLDESGNTMPTYTQEQVNAFARVFTGWRFAPAPAPGVPNYIDPMVVNGAQHDTGAKTLLNGVTLPAGQTTVQDLNDALDNIMEDPNVAPFVSRALIQHLVTSNPTPGYVARVASVFNGSGTGIRGDLRAVVRAILLDPEARGNAKPDPAYGRLRHPAQFIAGLLRAFDARSADGNGLSDGYLNPQSVNMGMDVFRPPSVFSYFSPGTVVPGSGGVRGPEFGLFTTSTALRRANFVNTMVFGRIAVSANAPAGTSLDFGPLLPLAPSPGTLVDALDSLLLHDTMSPEMRASIVSAVSAVSPANGLKRVRTAVYLIASSSQYQVER